MKLLSFYRIVSLAMVPLAILAAGTQAQAQSKPNWTWAKAEKGNYIEATASATDGAGNIYMTGNYQTVLTLGSTVLTSAPYVGGKFVVKYNAAGVVQWAQSFSSKYYSRTYDMAVDPTGNVFLTGYFADSLLFGGNYVRGTDEYDMFLLKYDKDGNALWAKTAGGLKGEFGNALAADNAGNVYVAGIYGYDNNMATADPGIFGTVTLNNNGSGDAFLAKYDASGNLLWVKGNGGSSKEIASTLAYDAANDNILVAGTFITGMTYEGTPLSTKGINDADVFVAKYDGAGQFAWVKSGGSLFDDATDVLAVDKNGNVGVALIGNGDVNFGSKTGTRTGTSSNSAIYLLKYDAAGNEQWVNYTGGRNTMPTSGLDFDKDGAAYISGHFSGTIVFNADTFKAPAGNYFLAKYDAAGKLDWGTGLGVNSITDILVDKNTSEVLIAGNFNSNSVQFSNNVIYGELLGSVYMARMAPFTKVSVAQPAVLAKGALYPVPASAQLYTTVSATDYAKVLIYDMNGRVVYDAPTTATIQLPLLQTGTYFVQFSGKAGIATEKIVIQQ